MSQPRNHAEGPRCPATGKVPMGHDQARRAAKTLNQRQRRDRWPVHAFYCRGCGKWHTGHVPRKDLRRGGDRMLKGSRKRRR